MEGRLTDSLIRAFYKRSFLITVITAFLLSITLPILLYYYDIHNYEKESLQLLSNFIKKEIIFDLERPLISDSKYENLLRKIDTFMEYSNLVEFKIWAIDTTLLYAYTDKKIIGEKFPDNTLLLKTIKHGTAMAKIESVSKAEDIALRKYGKLLEMYLPVMKDGKIIGAVEGYRMAPPVKFFGVHSLITGSTLFIIPLLLYSLLFGQFKKATAQIITYHNELEMRAEKELEKIFIEIITYHNELETAYNSLKRSYFDGIRSLAKALELRDMETEGHSERVVAFSVYIANKLSICEDMLAKLIIGAYLHDIGKIGISDNILLKPGKLTPEERKIMESHVIRGYELVKDIDFLNLGSDVILCHHEKWDGSGYPKKIKGEAIPIIARIFTLVDVFDALKNKRPYKEPFALEEIKKIILEEKGKHFDPLVADVFLEMTEREITEIIDEVKQKGIHHTVKFAIEKFLTINHYGSSSAAVLSEIRQNKG